jgi:ketosteroid isomerase-like protein
MHVKLQSLCCLILSVALHATQVWAQQTPSFSQVGAKTQTVAEPYFKAYIARDWKRLEPLLADNGGFSDPTAAFVFGSVKFEGKAATLKNFREGYAAISHMEFHQMRAFVSGEHAIYEGTLDWTLELKGGKQAVTRGMPFISVLRVVDGRVMEHRDFADYTPFLAAMRAAKSGG